MRSKIITICLLLLVGSVCYGANQMCRNKTYRAEIDKWATQGDLQISLTVVPLLEPAGTIFDGDTYSDRYAIEYIPTLANQVTFKYLITFDPNMCIEPPTRIWEATYEVVDPIPAPEIPVRPFVAVD